MNPKAGEHRCSELSDLDVEISARYHWSVARQLTSYSLRHWNLRNLTLQQECYLTNARDFFRNMHGSIMLPPPQPRVFARLGSLAIIVPKQCKGESIFCFEVTAINTTVNQNSLFEILPDRHLQCLYFVTTKTQQLF